MPSGGDPSAAKTRLRGAMSAVRRATSRKRGEQEAGRAAGGAAAGPPSTISTSDQRQGMLQRVSSRRHAPAAQDPRGGRAERAAQPNPPTSQLQLLTQYSNSSPSATPLFPCPFCRPPFSVGSSLRLTSDYLISRS